VVEANDVTVYSSGRRGRHKIIRKIETTTRMAPTITQRKLAYSADYLLVISTTMARSARSPHPPPRGWFPPPRLSETTVTADRVEMGFESQNKQSILSHVAAAGHGLVTSKPLAAPAGSSARRTRCAARTLK